MDMVAVDAVTPFLAMVEMRTARSFTISVQYLGTVNTEYRSSRCARRGSSSGSLGLSFFTVPYLTLPLKYLPTADTSVPFFTLPLQYGPSFFYRTIFHTTFTVPG